MKIDIDRVRISANGRHQLIQIKRRTKIDQFNIICRHALMMSLEEESIPPAEHFEMTGGVEIDWKVFCGGETGVYMNLLIMRCMQEGKEVSTSNVKEVLSMHLHRGLSYLNSNSEYMFD